MPLIAGRRLKNALTLSYKGGALPENLEEDICRVLTFDKLIRLYGEAAVDRDTGDRINLHTERRELYKIGSSGALTCMIGFLPRIRRMLKKRGFEFDYKDLSPPRPRPKAFDVDFDNVASKYDFDNPRRHDEVLALVVENDRGIIDACAGFGKSYFFQAVALAYPRARILIVVPDISNGRKTQRHLASVLPNIGFVGDKERSVERVTVATIGSVHHIDPEDVDIVLFDEIHKLITESNVKSALYICSGAGKVFSFTATTEGRMDNTDIRMEAVGGEVLFKMPYLEGVAAGIIVPVHVQWHNVITRENPCLDEHGFPMQDQHQRKKWGLWRHEFRNGRIAKVAGELRLTDQQHMIIVDHLEHALWLRHQALPDYKIIYAEADKKRRAKLAKQGLISEDMPLPPCDRDREYQSFYSGETRHVIATSVWGTGVSFDSLPHMLRAEARYGNQITDEQYPCRVNRLSPTTGKAYGTLHDFLDQFDPDGFHMAANSRRRGYKKIGYVQFEPTDNPRRQLRLL